VVESLPTTTSRPLSEPTILEDYEQELSVEERLRGHCNDECTVTAHVRGSTAILDRVRPQKT